MVPGLLIPSQWLSELQSLPRVAALALFLASLGMLVAGLRHHRLFVGLLFGTVGWVAGSALAGLMHVASWYVALPASLVAAAIVWPIGRRLVPVLTGFVGACALGAFMAYGLRLANYWVGFGVGFGGGLVLGWLAFRFAAVVLFGSVGTLGVLGTVAPVVGSESGPLAPGAYAAYPVAYVVAGVLLFLASLVAQVTFDSEHH